MKIRTSYVSNSSSTSYVIYGDIMESFDEIERSIEHGDAVIGIQKDGGLSGDSADFIFNITEARLKLMRNRFVGNQCLAIRKKWSSKDKYGCYQLPKSEGGRLFYFDRDYSSPLTNSVVDFHFGNWVDYFDLRQVPDEKTKMLFGRRINMKTTPEIIANGDEFMVYINGMFDWVLFTVKTEDDLKSLQKLVDFNRKNEYFHYNIYCMEPLKLVDNGEKMDFPQHDYVFLRDKEVRKLDGVKEFWEHFIQLKEEWV